MEILIEGKQLTLRVDETQAQTVNNTGIIEIFETKSKQNLYLGGLPKNVSQKALMGFHLKNTQSLKGLYFILAMYSLKIAAFMH